MLKRNIKKNLLFISPDALPPGISRAYWLANSLSRHFNVYYIQWEDSRKYHWLKDSTTKSCQNSIITSANSFFKSLFSRTRFDKNNSFAAENLIYTYLPIMQKGALSKFIGEINARKICRSFNKISLQKLLKKVDFSYIFHGDNMMLAPILSNSIPAFFDMQDDFDESLEEKLLMEYETDYLRKNVYFCKNNFAITDSTAKHMEQLAARKFNVLPNGANFEAFSAITEEMVCNLRQKLMLSDKFIISYIGGDIWFDKHFFESLAKMAANRDINIHFLLIGKLPKVTPAPNVTQLGFIEPDKINLYYRLSDVGMLPRAADEPFLKNSHPLKIIQYSAAQKPVIIPEMSESELFAHANVFQLSFKEELWLNKIELLKNFKWNASLTSEWLSYSWKHIGNTLANSMSASDELLNKQNL